MQARMGNKINVEVVWSCARRGACRRIGVRFLAGKYSNQDDREDEDHGQTEVLHLYHGSVACDFVSVG